MSEVTTSPAPETAHFSEAPPNQLRPEFQRTSRLAITATVMACVSLLSLLDMRLIMLPIVTSVFGVIALLAIRKHPDELTGVRLAWLATLSGPLLVVGSVAREQIQIRLEVPEGYEYVTWRRLAPDEETPLVPISEDARELAGKKIYIRGYVYPSTAKTNLKRFILVRDSGACCFGGQPKLSDMVVVDFKTDDRINYSLWPRGLGGTFEIKPPASQFKGVRLGAYHLEADHLK